MWLRYVICKNIILYWLLPYIFKMENIKSIYSLRQTLTVECSTYINIFTGHIGDCWIKSSLRNILAIWKFYQNCECKRSENQASQYNKLKIALLIITDIRIIGSFHNMRRMKLFVFHILFMRTGPNVSGMQVAGDTYH